MSPMWILVTCPALALAIIRVELKASPEDSDNQIRVSGSNIDVISDTERHTFRLHDYEVKDAVKKYFGKRPNDAYLRSCTPWGDLYGSYNWNQVTRIMKPYKGKFKSFHTERRILRRERLINAGPVPVTHLSTGKQQIVIAENEISTTWSRFSEGFTVSDSIIYDLSIHVGSQRRKVYYTGGFGQDDTHTEMSTGHSMNTTVVVNPGQTMTAEWSAMYGTMQFKVRYNATLQGKTAVNYFKKYKGHHFWGLGIRKVMAAAGKRNSRFVTETVNVNFYYDYNFELRDDKTRA